MSDQEQTSTQKKFEVVGDDIGQRIDLFLARHDELSLSRSQVQNLIASENILVNDKPTSNNHRLIAKEIIAITIPPVEISHLEPEDLNIEIVYEDEYLAVVNKPFGMVTHPGTGVRSGTLVNALLFHLNELADSEEPQRPGIVHRLDKNTSGLLIVAKKDESFKKLQLMIQAREIKRAYLGLICGHMPESSGTIDLPVARSQKDRKKMAVTRHNSRQAITLYKLLKRYRSYELHEVILQTGRTHQIRVHFSHLGHPVFGDPDYGGREKWHKGIFGPERPLGKRLLSILDRQALHAFQLQFLHPITEKEMKLEVEMPDDFKEVIGILDSEGY